MHATHLLTVLFVSFLFSAAASAQVFDNGPSDPALFTNVINLPGDVLPNSSIIGGANDETIQVNVAGGDDLGLNVDARAGSEVNISGGFVEGDFRAHSRSEVNISGGSVGGDFTADFFSVVNISGGSVGRGVRARHGSAVNISGGEMRGLLAEPGGGVNISGGFLGNINASDGGVISISGGSIADGLFFYSGSTASISGGSLGGRFFAQDGSDVELVGGDFKLNGEDFTDPIITLGDNDVLTATLADGSAYIFTERGENDVLNGVRLTSSSEPLPTASPTPIVVATPVGSGPQSLREGQSVTLQTGGEFGGSLAVIEATLNVEGGAVEDSLEVAGGIVNMSGGSVGGNFDAFSGSEINISDGSVGSFFNAFQGSAVNISGGSIEDGFFADSGSAASISGGGLGGYFRGQDGSDVELVGGEFKLNGEAFTGPVITLEDNDVFTGTLADGSAFLFSASGINRDDINGVSLTSSSEPLPDANLIPIVIATPVDDGPQSLRAGQSLTLQAGGELGSELVVVEATLNVEGGTLGGNLEVSEGIVNISDGYVGTYFDAYNGSAINISGGEVHSGLSVTDGSEVNISGGAVGRSSGSGGSVFNISGGSLAPYGSQFEDCEINISGGTVGNELGARNCEVNISGGEVGFESFAVDGVVNISGGEIGFCFGTGGSEVNISGGKVGENFHGGDVVNITGGEVGEDFSGGAVVNISGGEVGDRLSGDEVNISGGSVGSLEVSDGSEINLFGSDFVLDGVALDDLIEGEAFTIIDRDVTLSGRLFDGSAFSFDLNTEREFIRESLFQPGATLTVTLKPQLQLGDCNLDGVVNFFDIPSFVSILSAGDYLAEADTNEDGVVSFLDIGPFIIILFNQVLFWR